MLTKRKENVCKYLRHYTSLSHLIDILENHHLPLMNPFFWTDKNDAFCVEKSSKNAVGVICFSTLNEECNLFWESYAKDGVGVCILFNKKEIEKILNSKSEYINKKVEYLTYDKDGYLQDTKHKSFRITDRKDLAFIKNIAYEIEHEYRIVLFSKKTTIQCSKVIGYLKLGSKMDKYISKILLSPFLSESQRKDIKHLLEIYLEKTGLGNIEVKSSKIAEDVKWRNAIRKLKRNLQKGEKNEDKTPFLHSR